MIEHVNILIATPGRSMEAEYVRSLAETMQYLSKRNISFKYMNQYSPRVDAAREATAMDSSFLDASSSNIASGKVSYDKIFWIDSDISWQVSDFVKLFESEHDIISGLYFSDQGTPMFNPIGEGSKESFESIIFSESPQRIFGCGFGFLAVRSGVFEKIPRPWFESKFFLTKDESSEKDFFATWSEDYSWCIKANQSGFSVMLDPTVRVTHNKKIGIR